MRKGLKISEVRTSKAITDTANSICITPSPLEQKNQQLELTGNANAKLAGVIGKVVSIGVGGATKYTTQASQNVLQRDLAQAIKNGEDCKLSVFNTLVAKMLPSLLPSAPVQPAKSLATQQALLLHSI